MKIKTVFIVVLAMFALPSLGQKTENVLLITLDGFRWQEVFKGADSLLLFEKKYTEGIEKTAKEFWNTDPLVRREMLMPFLWSKFKEEGVIAGNRDLGSKVNVKNIYGFSYPGYNEILTGYPDEKVSSNDKINNENVSVLEVVNATNAHKGKVAAFSTWDVFPFIINAERNGIYVNTAGSITTKTGSETEALLNDLEQTVPSLGSGRHDFVTFYHAFDYLKNKQPDFLYVAFDETDEFAHEGKYREYLYAGRTIDSYVAKLWEYCQSNEKYKDKTTLIITTDHGRGDADKSQWTSHGQKVPDCGEIWIAAIGPDTPANGELNSNSQLYQNQIAETIARLFKTKMNTGKPTGEAIGLIVK